MENAVKKLEPAVEEVEKTRLPDMGLVLKGSGRAHAVAKLREMADKLESGELDGARVQWRERNAEEVANGAPSEMVTVTITPRTGINWEAGTVQLLTFKIFEEGTESEEV